MRCCEWSVCDALGPQADPTNTGGRGVATNGLGPFQGQTISDFFLGYFEGLNKIQRETNVDEVRGL